MIIKLFWCWIRYLTTSEVNIFCSGPTLRRLGPATVAVVDRPDERKGLRTRRLKQVSFVAG